MMHLLRKKNPGSTFYESGCFNRRLILIFIFTSQVFYSVAQNKKAASPARKPNILFILLDDLGWTDLGAFGSTFYDTPNIDKLAGQSVKFTSAYSACPVCSPSRAGIMTGKYPAELQITDWIGAKQPEEELKETRPDKIRPLLPAPYKPYLPSEEFTVAESMKKAGYNTFIAGKWHLANAAQDKQYMPVNQGFDSYFEGAAKHQSKGVFELADEVCNFIEKNQASPFFAYFSTYSVHIPLNATPENIEKYRKKRADMNLKDEFEITPSGKVRKIQGNPTYAAMVYEMDEAVGRVLSKLEQLNLQENTIVILASDNGGVSTAQGWPTANAPLRGGKGWLYEGGIRIPFMFKWPGVTKPGTVNNSPLIETDIYPTLLEITSQPLLKQQHTAGISFLPLIKNSASAKRTLFWHYPHYGDQGGSPGSAVRDGDWKLIHWYVNDKYELFNLKDDIGEQHDLLDKYPRIAGELKNKLRDWLKKENAKFPSVNPNYKKL